MSLISKNPKCITLHSDQVARRIRLITCMTSLFVVVLIEQPVVLANGWIFLTDECGGEDEVEIRESITYESCESGKLMDELENRVGTPCKVELNACVADRISEFGDSRDEAEDFCVDRPSNLDSSFRGACPTHLDQLESDAYDGDEWLLDRTYSRLGFDRFAEEHHEVFRQGDSAIRLRKLLEAEPDNLAALGILSVLYDENGIVETLKLEIRKYELERDCREHWAFSPRWLYTYVSTLAENWLEGTGSGSELNENELREVVEQVRNMLIDLYDNAMDRSVGIHKLDYALASINDPILTGEIDDLKQIATSIGIDLDNHAGNRRTALVRKLTSTYGVESAFGHKDNLGMICNDTAFEIGLEEHCLELLEHYSTQVELHDESLARDWTQAATLLVNGLTSDCSKPLDAVGSNGRCIGDRHQSFTNRLIEMMSSIPQQSSDAERELLEAYLRMDETSDEFFIRSLATDHTKVYFAENLARRLHKRGKSQAALNIVKSSINALNQSALDVQKLDVVDEESDGERKSQVQLNRLELLLRWINEGQYHNCKESYKHAPWLEEVVSENTATP